MSASVVARVRAAVAAGFAGRPSELAEQLGVDVLRIYDARNKGATWPLPGLEGRRFNEWTVMGRDKPTPSGVSTLRVMCSCSAVHVREAGDILGGRSKMCQGCHEAGSLRAMRLRARSRPCPVPGCTVLAIANLGNVDVATATVGCADIPGERFEWGVHVERARAAGCPPMPTVAQLDRGVDPLRGRP